MHSVESSIAAVPKSICTRVTRDQLEGMRLSCTVLRRWDSLRGTLQLVFDCAERMAKALEWKPPMTVEVWGHRSLLSEPMSLVAVSVAGATRRLFGRGLAGKGCGLFWIRGMLWGVRTTAGSWNVPKKHGPYGELFFLLIEKELVVFQGDGGLLGTVSEWRQSEACALCGLRTMAERPSGTVEENTSMCRVVSFLLI